MSNIKENLDLLQDAKLNIKAAIEAKGVSDVGLDITIYKKKIEEIPQAVSESKITVDQSMGYILQKAGTVVDAKNITLPPELTTLRQYFNPEYTRTIQNNPITSIDLTAWDLAHSQVSDYSQMFGDLRNLTEVKGLETLPTDHKVSVDLLFQSTGFTNLDFIKNWDSSQISSAWGFCTSCNNLTELRLGWRDCNFGIHSFANNCPKLTTVDLSTWDFKGNGGWWEDPSLAPVYALRPFKDCPKLVNLNLNGGFFNRSKSSVFSGKGTFRNTDLSGLTWLPGTDLETWLHDLNVTSDDGQRPAVNSRLYLDASQISNLKATTSLVDSSISCYESISNFGWDIIDVANTPD